MQKKGQKRLLKPQWVIVIGFLIMVLIGSGLLMLPRAVAPGVDPLSLSEAFFTATSASCVTGLTVIDVGSRLSRFGQIVLISLVQLGGIGITAFSTFFLMILGKRISLQSETVLMDAFGVDKSRGVKMLLAWAVGVTFFMELCGAGIFYHQYRFPVVPGMEALEPRDALYYALFHGVSAFCNAGFSLHSINAVQFQLDPLYLGTVATLILFGGIGFLVLMNIFSIKFWRKNLRTRGRISLHSKIVLTTTIAFVLVGGCLVLWFEWGESLKDLPVVNKISCAFFHAVSARTSGFNAMPMEFLTEKTKLMSTLFMMIGGSPGSAAGGIKTTTFAVLLATAFAMCRNRTATIIGGKTIPESTVREAMVIGLVAFVAVLACYGALLFTEVANGGVQTPEKLLFESVSALATVGLSCDYTGHLSEAGRWIIIVAMFIGRIGPISVVLLISSRETEQLHIAYPEEGIVVG